MATDQERNRMLACTCLIMQAGRTVHTMSSVLISAATENSRVEQDHGGPIGVGQQLSQQAFKSTPYTIVVQLLSLWHFVVQSVINYHDVNVLQVLAPSHSAVYADADADADAVRLSRAAKHEYELVYRSAGNICGVHVATHCIRGRPLIVGLKWTASWYPGLM